MDSGIGKCIDRISSLPDCVLGHILSLLPTEEAVRTGVLAKRWENLWIYIPILDFNEYQWFRSFNDDEAEVGKWFVRFVTQVLRRSRAPCLQQFSLDISTLETTQSVNTWVSTAITRNVQVLDLINRYEDSVLVPPLIFGSTTLRYLFIQGVIFEVPDQVWLPSLKTARFSDIESENADSLERFLAGCPVLEELKLRRNYFANQTILVISVPTLKDLEIDCFGDDVDAIEHVPPGEWGEVVIDAPKLEFLQIWDHYLDDFNIKNLLSLVVVDIYLDRVPPTPTDAGIPIYKLLTGLSHVKTLSANFFSHPDVYGYELPTFGNLTKLDISTVNSKLVGDILQCSPNLEVLILGADWEAPGRVPNCFVSRLKNVMFEGCRGEGNELQLIEYFLKNAEALEKMVVDCTDANDDFAEILKGLPRSSNICQLHVHRKREILMREGVFLF